MPPVGMTNNGQLIHPIPTHTQKAAKHLQKDEQMGVGYLHHESGVQDFDLAGLWCGVCGGGDDMCGVWQLDWVVGCYPA